MAKANDKFLHPQCLLTPLPCGPLELGWEPLGSEITPYPICSRIEGNRSWCDLFNHPSQVMGYLCLKLANFSIPFDVVFSSLFSRLILDVRFFPSSLALLGGFIRYLKRSQERLSIVLLRASIPLEDQFYISKQNLLMILYHIFDTWMNIAFMDESFKTLMIVGF